MSLPVYSRASSPSIHKNAYFLPYNCFHFSIPLPLNQIPILITLSPGLLALPLGLSLPRSVLQTLLPYFPPGNIASSSNVIRPPLYSKQSLVPRQCLHKYKFLNLYLIYSNLNILSRLSLSKNSSYDLPLKKPEESDYIPTNFMPDPWGCSTIFINSF